MGVILSLQPRLYSDDWPLYLDKEPDVETVELTIYNDEMGNLVVMDPTGEVDLEASGYLNDAKMRALRGDTEASVTITHTSQGWISHLV